MLRRPLGLIAPRELTVARRASKFRENGPPTAGGKAKPASNGRPDRRRGGPPERSTAHHESALLQAAAASERQPEADLGPSSDPTVADGQDGSPGLDPFINEGGNGRGRDSGLRDLNLTRSP